MNDVPEAHSQKGSATDRGPEAWCGGEERTKHPGTLWLSGGRSFFDPPAAAGFLSGASIADGANLRQPPKKKRGSEGVGVAPRKQIAAGALVAPHATTTPQRTSPPRSAERRNDERNGGVCGRVRHEESATKATTGAVTAGAADGRLQHGEGSGWRRRVSVRGTSANPQPERPATAPRTTSARSDGAMPAGALLADRRQPHSAPTSRQRDGASLQVDPGGDRFGDSVRVWILNYLAGVVRII